MAQRNQEPLRVSAFVKMEGQEVDLDTLPTEKQSEIGARLGVAWLNAIFRGQAVFRADLPESSGGEPGP